MILSHKEIRQRFAELCKQMGLPAERFAPLEGGWNPSIIGHAFLEYAAVYGGWSAAQIVNEVGGEIELTPHRLNSRGMLAWMAGIALGLRFAHVGARYHLDKFNLATSAWEPLCAVGSLDKAIDMATAYPDGQGIQWHASTPGEWYGEYGNSTGFFHWRITRT